MAKPPILPAVRALHATLLTKDAWYLRGSFKEWLKKSHARPDFIDIVASSYIYATDETYGKLYSRYSSRARTDALEMLMSELSFGEAQAFFKKLPNNLRGKAQAAIINKFTEDPQDQHTQIATISSLDASTESQKRKVFLRAWKEGNINALEFFLQPQFLDLVAGAIAGTRGHQNFYLNPDYIHRLIATFPSCKQKIYRDMVDVAPGFYYSDVTKELKEPVKLFLQEIFLYHLGQPDTDKLWGDLSDYNRDFWLGVYKICPKDPRLREKVQNLTWSALLVDAQDIEAQF
jgi:hypothetical protein